MTQPFSDAEGEDLQLTLAMVSEQTRERFYASADAAREVLADPAASESRLRAGLSLIADGFDMVHRDLLDQGLTWPGEA